MIDLELLKKEIVEYLMLEVSDSILYVSYPTSEKIVIKIWNRREFERVLSLLNNLTKKFNDTLLNLYTRDRIKTEFKLNSVTYELVIEFSER